MQTEGGEFEIWRLQAELEVAPFRFLRIAIPVQWGYFGGIGTGIGIMGMVKVIEKEWFFYSQFLLLQTGRRNRYSRFLNLRNHATSRLNMKMATAVGTHHHDHRAQPRDESDAARNVLCRRDSRRIQGEWVSGRMHECMIDHITKKTYIRGP